MMDVIWAITAAISAIVGAWILKINHQKKTLEVKNMELEIEKKKSEFQQTVKNMSDSELDADIRKHLGE